VLNFGKKRVKKFVKEGKRVLSLQPLIRIEGVGEVH